jgi:hypothetical protein
MMAQHRAVIRTALAIVLFVVISHTRADPDLWGHVLFGKDIASARSLPGADSYSFTSDRPWINHEWLAECAMYVAFAIGGGPGLVVLKMLVLLATLGLVWSGLRQQLVDTGARDLLMALTVVGTFPQSNHVRPQIFSIVAFAALLWILVRGGSVQRLLLIPILFAAWINFHGGWIVGGGVLALWAALSLPSSSVSRSEKSALFLAGALSLIGTLANPYGWQMWQFLWSTVGFGRPEITDWQPLYRLGAGFVALWVIVTLAGIAGGVHARRSKQWELRRLAVVVALGLASFQVSRLLAFFAIAVVLLQGRDIAAALNAWRRPATTAQPEPARFAAATALVIAAVLVVGGAVAAASNVTCVRMQPDQSEPEIVTLVKERDLRGRLVVWFDWGEYAIWHFAPALRVSIDGRRETVYSDRIMQEHLNFYYVPASREAFLAETRPDHIWLQADLPVVATLLADGWRPLYRGLRSIWLTRSELPEVARLQSQAEAGRRCFPGP